jgi:two-component system response regulator DesR
MIRVLIAEDQELIRTALVTLIGLEPDIEVVGQAEDGAQAVAKAAEIELDLVVLDIDMPVMDGLTAAERLAERHPGLSMVMLTSHGRPGYLKRAVQAGVRGFITKNVSGTDLAKVIREVHGGGRYLDTDLVADAMFAGDCPLAPRELEILRLVEDGSSISAVAKALSLQEGTIRNYISSAITKLGVDNRTSAVRHARNMGWL